MPAKKSPIAELPPITDAERASAHDDNPGSGYTISTRLFNPELGCTYQLTFTDGNLILIDSLMALWIEEGYLPCQSPDAPVQRTPDQVDTRANGFADRPRPGTRQQKPKDERMVLPFALKGEYRGWSLQEIEDDNPGAINWLAAKCNMPDIRKAAQAIIARREGDLL